jgi:hypothetical protein
MNLYIRIRDGKPFEHPILEDNFRQAYPDIDLHNLPAEFARFQRVPRPAADPGKYIVSAHCTYEWAGDQVQDTWHVTQATLPEE